MKLLKIIYPNLILMRILFLFTRVMTASIMNKLMLNITYIFEGRKNSNHKKYNLRHHGNKYCIMCTYFMFL